MKNKVLLGTIIGSMVVGGLVTVAGLRLIGHADAFQRKLWKKLNKHGNAIEDLQKSLRQLEIEAMAALGQVSERIRTSRSEPEEEDEA